MLAQPRNFSPLFARAARLSILCLAIAGSSPARGDGPGQATVDSAKRILADPASSQPELTEAEDRLREALDDAADPQVVGEAALALASAALLVRHDLPASIPLFERARELLPTDSRAWSEATFGLATAIQHRLPVSPDSIQRATGLFESVLASDRSSLLAARSLVSIGRIHEVVDYTGDRQRLPEARQRYEAVVAGWPDHPVADEAAFRLGSTYAQEAYYPPESRRADWDWRIETILTGVAYLEQWARERADAPLAPGVWEYIGNCYLLLPAREEWRAKALRAFLEATGDGALIETGGPAPLKSNLDRVNPGYLYLRIAGLAHQQGLREVAFEYYGRLISEVPDYAYGPEAALQLTANLGYTREQVVERLRWQYQALNYSEVEIQRLVEDFEFLAPPEGVPVPQP